MKLAFFSHYFYPEISAPSARIGDLSRQCAEMGHESHVVTCFPNHPSGRIFPGYSQKAYTHEQIKGVHIHRNWTYITPNTGTLKRTLGHMSFWMSARRHSIPRLPKIDCAIGSSPTFFAAMAARDCARIQGIPFIMEVRDLWPAIFRDLGIIRNKIMLRILERWEMSLYRAAERIVTVTDSFRDDIVSRGVPREKVVTITNGADTKFWTSNLADPAMLRRQHALGDAFVVLYMGTHGISQGLRSQLQAAVRLKPNKHIRFVFVGDGSEKERLLNEARDLGLWNTIFLEPVGRVAARDYYAMADLCLVPLRNLALFDTFIPSKMFEIMSMGRPIVASLRGEAAKILDCSGSAIVVAPEDSDAIAEAIRDLSCRPEKRLEMGSAGQRYAEAHYSRASQARRYLQVLSETELLGVRSQESA